MKPLHASAVFVFVMSSFLGLSAALGTSDYANGHAANGYGVAPLASVGVASVPVPSPRDEPVRLAAR